MMCWDMRTNQSWEVIVKKATSKPAAKRELIAPRGGGLAIDEDARAHDDGVGRLGGGGG